MFCTGVTEVRGGWPWIVWAVMSPVDCYESTSPETSCYVPIWLLYVNKLFRQENVMDNSFVRGGGVLFGYLCYAEYNYLSFSFLLFMLF